MLDSVNTPREVRNVERHLLTCTFCKRSEDQVRKLIAGPGVYICDRCTDHAHTIIHEDESPSLQPALLQRTTSRLRRLVSRLGITPKVLRAIKLNGRAGGLLKSR